MMDRAHDLPLNRQAKALGISRGSVYYLPRTVPAADLALMCTIDVLHLEYPSPVVGCCSGFSGQMATRLGVFAPPR